MLLDVRSAHGLFDAVAVLLLGTALLSVLVRRLDRAVPLLAVQGVLLAVAAAAVVAESHEGHGWITVLVTFLVKAVAIPAVLAYALRGIRVRREAQAVLSRKQTFPIAVALVLVAYYAAGPLDAAGGFLTRNALPAALSMLLLGLFNMLKRRQAAAQVVALVTMENGIYLAAIAVTRGLPLAVELGVALDVLVGVVVMGLVFRQVYVIFETTDTDRLSALRG